MLIKRIRAKNFKTYLNLDLDIVTDPDKPIVLIGGANGGGKTTFFDAIYGALYGLQINTERNFNELLNAGALGKVDEKIELELFFSGRVLNQEQSYVLTLDKPGKVTHLRRMKLTMANGLPRFDLSVG